MGLKSNFIVPCFLVPEVFSSLVWLTFCGKHQTGHEKENERTKNWFKMGMTTYEHNFIVPCVLVRTVFVPSFSWHFVDSIKQGMRRKTEDQNGVQLWGKNWAWDGKHETKNRFKLGMRWKTWDEKWVQIEDEQLWEKTGHEEENRGPKMGSNWGWTDMRTN
jgi:hypothetical protein